MPTTSPVDQSAFTNAFWGTLSTLWNLIPWWGVVIVIGLVVFACIRAAQQGKL